jgi:3-methyladenine DNA glycosylase AlkD
MEIEQLQRRLEDKANAKTKDWWQRYLKGVIGFRGVKMGDIRIAVHAWYVDGMQAEALSAPKQRELALALVREAYAEDKLAGMIMLQEILIPGGVIKWKSDLPRLAKLFDAGHIYDWNSCDWFCLKVLGCLVKEEGEVCARAIAAWKRAANLWRRRAAGVAFVDLASNGEANFSGFTQMLLGVCAETVQASERFAQTGTGWVLRELAYAEEQGVVRFIEQNLALFSSEGLRYATEKMHAADKARLRQAGRQAVKTAGH